MFGRNATEEVRNQKILHYLHLASACALLGKIHGNQIVHPNAIL